ncbi:Hypothetical predicted protein [Mytilus galloprovincialis]|uniref:Uncharacterized protein n=1 Tax=Mytilus galloprovincialis TaxID=29158 RepID=A0A8B6DM84_MYTGA|nr:Hypothetical predicted protein [Mytilus galloprovincialis]
MKTRRAGHRGVLTKLLKKVEPSSEELLQEYDVSELSTIRGLIVKKQETIDQLNEKIVRNYQEEEVSEENRGSRQIQIGLDEEDHDSTRFFWLRDPSNPSGLETYRFKVILFGATCSPFILNATLLKHLSTVTSATAEILKRDLYVDNVLTSVDTEEGSLYFFEESRALMTNPGFNLRTWKSNSNQLSDEATKVNVLDKDSETKILGMRLDSEIRQIYIC